MLAAASRKGPWQGAALKASGSAPHEAHGTFVCHLDGCCQPRTHSQHTARQSFITEWLQGAINYPSGLREALTLAAQDRTCNELASSPITPGAPAGRGGGPKHSWLWSAQQDPRLRSAKAFRRHRISSAAKRLPQVSAPPRQITLDQLEANAFRLN